MKRTRETTHAGWDVDGVSTQLAGNPHVHPAAVARVATASFRRATRAAGGQP